jgi:ABC-2 type transport system ATP-binding protein
VSVREARPGEFVGGWEVPAGLGAAPAARGATAVLAGPGARALAGPGARAVGVGGEPARPGPPTRPDAVLSCQVERAEAGHLTLRDVTFDVGPGEAFGLLGPAGSGKAAIVRLVCGIVTPEAGAVLVGGRPVGALAATARHAAVGYAPECAVVVPGRSVADNLRFWGRLSGVATLRAGVAAALALAGLEERATAVAERCSLGTQRLLALAVAVLHRPRLVVLADPLAGLDGGSTDALVAALARLRSRGTAVLCTGTAAADLAWLCDRVGHLDAGRLRSETGTAP